MKLFLELVLVYLVLLGTVVVTVVAVQYLQRRLRGSRTIVISRPKPPTGRITRIK